MDLRTALKQGQKLLDDAGVSAPRLTAEVLLCHALGKEKVYLYAHPEEELPELAWIHYGRYLHERMQGKPTQYITRHQEFYGRDFHVSSAVLIPRPETEHLVETALRLAPRAACAIDLGCGSGAIGISYALESGARTILSDLSLPALHVARGNAARLGADTPLHQADFASALRGLSVDLILCNPPYVPQDDESILQREIREHEPSLALYGGKTGVEPYRVVVAQARFALRPGGWLLGELGYQGLAAVRALVDDADWEALEVVHDLAGWPRVLAARRASP
ncbi:MAG: peptide chain release factor N(5)-glutamine methyltransferase [Bryobacterales bacterium]|nr:peptide chain release factor N(5)-glutamine methyltransferase [Bryobacterales bacterium]